MSKKVAIFPIDYNTVAIARFAYLNNYDPIALLAPDLSTLAGEDIAKLDGGSEAGILLHSDYMPKVCEADVIYLVDSIWSANDNIYKDIYNYAKSLGKEVKISKHLNRRLNLQSEMFSDKNKEYFDFTSDLKLMPIDAPIISVFSIGDYCGQSQTEYSIRKYFLDKGYKVMQICSHEHGHLIGCLPLPDFLYDITIAVADKILMFNRFIHRHSKNENPDVIILGVPQPIMKYNDFILNGFGILPFIVQHAVQSDIGIVSLYYNEQYTYEYLENFANLCKYRFGVSAEFFSVSNCSISRGIDRVDELEYLYLTSDFVDNKLKKNSENNRFTIFAAYNEDDSYKAFSNIESLLQNNPTIV